METLMAKDPSGKTIMFNTFEEKMKWEERTFNNKINTITEEKKNMKNIEENENIDEIDEEEIEEIKANQTSFVLYYTDNNAFSRLTDEQAGRLIKAVFRYHMSGEIPDFKEDVLVDFMFETIKTHLDKNKEKYVKRVLQNRKNGQAGGRAKSQKNQ